MYDHKALRPGCIWQVTRRPLNRHRFRRGRITSVLFRGEDYARNSNGKRVLDYAYLRANRRFFDSLLDQNDRWLSRVGGSRWFGVWLLSWQAQKAAVTHGGEDLFNFPVQSGGSVDDEVGVGSRWTHEGNA